LWAQWEQVQRWRRWFALVLRIVRMALMVRGAVCGLVRAPL
jgi:hypothetical protein